MSGTPSEGTNVLAAPRRLRLLDGFNDTMEAIFFVSYLGLMLVVGWTLFDDDRVLFILIVLYVVVVGGFYALLRHRQQTVLLHPAIRAVLFLHWLVLAAPLRLARGMAQDDRTD